MLHADLPGGDEGEGAFEAEVLDGLGGEGEGSDVEEGHPGSGRRRRGPAPGAGVSRESVDEEIRVREVRCLVC